MDMDAGELNIYIRLDNPTTPVANGDGDYTDTPTAADPTYAWASIAAATQRSLERLVANTVAAQASHIMRMRFRADVTTQTQISWTDRARRAHVANVTFVDDVKGAGTELLVLCQEVVQ